MKTVGTKQELPTQVLTGSKSHRHSAFQLRSTTANCTTRGVLKAGEAQIGRDEAASCATKDSGSLFAALPPIMAACCLTARMDRMGRGGQNRCRAGNSNFFSHKALIQSIFKVLGEKEVTGGTGCSGKQDARSKPKPASQKRAEFPFIGIIIVEPPHVPFLSVGLPLGGRWHV